MLDKKKKLKKKTLKNISRACFVFRLSVKKAREQAEEKGKVLTLALVLASLLILASRLFSL